MELDEALYQRRSIRHFDPQRTVARETIAALIATAAMAPSAGNRQGWRVAAVGPADARALCDALEPQAWSLNYAIFRQVIARDPNVMGRAPSERELTEATLAWVEREIRLTGDFWLLVVHFERRPDEEVAALSTSIDDILAHLLEHHPEPGLAERVRSRKHEVAAVDQLADLGSVAGFMFGLTLAATQAGLASCIQYTWRLVAPELRERLAIPASHEVLGAVAVGYLGDVDPAYVARHYARRPVPTTWHDQRG